MPLLGRPRGARGSRREFRVSSLDWLRCAARRECACIAWSTTKPPMDLLRKALRDVEAAVKSPLQSLVTKTDPNDLTGTVVVVGGEKFHVKDMFAEGGAARVYRCSLVVGDGPESDGHTAVSDSKQTKKANSLALKQCLLNPELSDAEARHEGTIHALVSDHTDVVTLRAHDVYTPNRQRPEDPPPPRAALLVMDLCFESLADVTRERGGLPEPDALEACASAARAVARMHARVIPIIHRDVKPENVLGMGSSEKTKSAQWRLCDFGSAALGEQKFQTSKDRSRAEAEFQKHTTPTYRSPEMWDVHRFSGQGVGKPADVWCLGCLLFETLEGRPPFGADSKLLALQGKFQVTKSVSKRTGKLIGDMLRVNPTDRPSAEEVAVRCDTLASATREGDVDTFDDNSERETQKSETETVETGWAAFGDDEGDSEKKTSDEEETQESSQPLTSTEWTAFDEEGTNISADPKPEQWATF